MKRQRVRPIFIMPKPMVNAARFVVRLPLLRPLVLWVPL